MGRAQNTVKRRTFWPDRVVCGWGGGPSLLRRGEKRRTAMPRPGGPWPDLSAYARQPARGPTMLAHFVASWGYVAHLGAMLAPLGAMLAHLEAYVGPSWGYVGPSWGLCWPILGLCWPILRPMLAHPGAHVGPSWPILNHKTRKMGKNGKSTKHRKTGQFLAGPGGRRQGARPLSPTERRETPYGYATARGPLAGFKRLRATAGQGPNYGGPSCGYVGLCWPHVDPCWAERSEKWEW